MTVSGFIFHNKAALSAAAGSVLELSDTVTSFQTLFVYFSAHT